MKIYYQFLYLAILGLLAGSWEKQSPAHASKSDESWQIYHQLLFLVVLGLLAGDYSRQPAGRTLQSDRSFTLRTEKVGGRMVYMGVGGDGVLHDFAIPELGIQTQPATGIDSSTEVIFNAGDRSDFIHMCPLPDTRRWG